MNINHLVDIQLELEKLRVASEVRQSHLKLNDNYDIQTQEVINRLVGLETWLDATIGDLLEDHPAYHWFSRVKGIGRENIAKVIGLIDISKANTISSLRKFAGYAPVNGHAMKRIKGQKLEYNSQLRSMCWRVGVSLMKAGGCFYHYYLKEKEKYVARYTNQGYKILATPAGKWMCENCGASWKTKKEVTECCPKQAIIQKVKEEPEGIIYQGHLHNQALRKMIQLFLACLWLEWRKGEGLPISTHYVIDKLGHDSFISPEEMTDRKEEILEKDKVIEVVL